MKYPISSAMPIPKKAVVINDLTGFGRCSLSVVLPVINAMHVQACPVATSIFSNHMGFPSYYYKDLTDSLAPCFHQYDELQLNFDGICCGFLNSPKQFHDIRQFLEKQRQNSNPLILIDPVMGDQGKPYRLVTEQIRREMKCLISYATILTPNLTESCMLTDTPFPDGPPAQSFLQELTGKLLDLGIQKVAVTGITYDNYVMNYCMEKTQSGVHTFSYQVSSNGESRPGTGDIFAAILTADALNHVPFESSVKKAADFIRLCVNASSQAHIPVREGVLFENYLPILWEASAPE